MTASRPDNEATFHAARDIPDPDRRQEYVRDTCGGDETRIARVEALLAAADRTDSLLDRPAAAIPLATIDQSATESPGTVVGPYKLIEPIGEGGMGSVWMAQQTDKQAAKPLITEVTTPNVKRPAGFLPPSKPRWLGTAPIGTDSEKNPPLMG